MISSDDNDIFETLREKYDEELIKNKKLPNSKKTKLIEIVFRIKNNLSKDKRYFINAELNNLKINLIKL